MKVRWPKVPIFNEVKMDKWLYKLILLLTNNYVLTS